MYKHSHITVALLDSLNNIPMSGAIVLAWYKMQMVIVELLSTLNWKVFNST